MNVQAGDVFGYVGTCVKTVMHVVVSYVALVLNSSTTIYEEIE